MRLLLGILHFACAAVLLAAHATFLFRGLSIEAGKRTPRKLDRLARSLAQALLPATALAGLALAAANRRVEVPHLLFGLAPLVAVPLVYAARVLLRKRTQAPWLLPVLNLVLLAAAAATGFMPRR